MRTLTVFLLWLALAPCLLPAQALQQRLHQAEQALEARDYRRTLALLDSADKVESYNPRVYLLRGITYHRMGDNGSAISALNISVERDKTNHEAWYWRGKVHKALGQYIRAVADFDRTLLAQPQHTEALYQRGLAKITLQDHQGGCADLTQAASMGHDSAIDSKEVFCNQ